MHCEWHVWIGLWLWEQGCHCATSSPNRHKRQTQWIVNTRQPCRQCNEFRDEMGNMLIYSDTTIRNLSFRSQDDRDRARIDRKCFRLPQHHRCLIIVVKRKLIIINKKIVRKWKTDSEQPQPNQLQSRIDYDDQLLLEWYSGRIIRKAFIRFSEHATAKQRSTKRFMWRILRLEHKLLNNLTKGCDVCR